MTVYSCFVICVDVATDTIGHSYIMSISMPYKSVRRLLREVGERSVSVTGQLAS